MKYKILLIENNSENSLNIKEFLEKYNYIELNVVVKISRRNSIKHDHVQHIIPRY